MFVSTMNYMYCCFILCDSAIVNGFYLMSDYYMDAGHSKTFGGICNKTVLDDSFYLNSHVNNLKLTKYPANNDCSMVVDAGTMSGARYTVYIEYMDLQGTDDTGICSADYLRISERSPISDLALTNRTLCGEYNLNVSQSNWVASQPKIFINFKTDAVVQKNGFRIKFVRSEPLPCQSNEWLCRHENRCIDARLKCDGTQHCLQNDDEENCNAWEKFIGNILALGLSGVVAIAVSVPTACTVIGVILCIMCCCKRFRCKQRMETCMNTLFKKRYRANQNVQIHASETVEIARGSNANAKHETRVKKNMPLARIKT